MHCTKAEVCSVDSPLDKTFPVLGWVGWDWNVLYCSRQNLESSDDGSVSTLSVLDADWSVITKYRGVFDLMNINELKFTNYSYCWLPAHLLCAGADQLLTSDINPSDFYVSKCSTSIHIAHIQTVLTKHIEVSALGHKMWQFINSFLQSYRLLIFLFTLVNLTVSFNSLLEAL